MKKKLIFTFLILLPFYGIAQNSGTVKISVKEYQDKVYASWLGQCIAVRFASAASAISFTRLGAQPSAPKLTETIEFLKTHSL